MEEDKVNLLINNGLINNIKMLMIEDPVWCVREAAAGVMRYTIFTCSIYCNLYNISLQRIDRWVW